MKSEHFNHVDTTEKCVHPKIANPILMFVSMRRGTIMCAFTAIAGGW